MLCSDLWSHADGVLRVQLIKHFQVFPLGMFLSYLWYKKIGDVKHMF